MEGVPEGVKPLCAAHLFEYDEEKAMNLLNFFSVYKSQFPMLVVIIGGHDGDTIYDCYDNLQVLRIDGYSSQPRVVADDPRLHQMYKRDAVTIPEDTLIKFRAVKGHTQLGNRQKLSEILVENDKQFPLLVKMSCDSHYPIRIGLNKHVANDFGNILIKEAFVEHFYMMNSIDNTDLKITTQICMACLSEDLDATPVTGFKYRSKAEFNEYCRRLTEEVRHSGEEYDMTNGNHDLSEYTYDEMRRLLDVSEFRTGTMLYEEPDMVEVDYEEMSPVLPTRHLIKADSIPHTTAQPTHTNILPAAKDTKHQRMVTSPTKPTGMSPKPLQSPTDQTNDTEVHKKTGFFSKQVHRIKAIGGKSSVERDGFKASKQTALKDIQTASISQAIPVHDTECIKPKLITTPHKPVHKPPVDLPHKSDPSTNIPQVAPKPHVDYQNTKIGRATIKPMIAAKVGEDKRDKEVDKTVDYCGPYELLSVKPNTEPNRGHLTDVESISTTCAQLEECSSIYDALESGNKPIEADEKPQPFTVRALSIKGVGERLAELKLAKYAVAFAENQVDGVILSSLSVEDLVNELGLSKLEAIRLYKFVESGHVPK